MAKDKIKKKLTRKYRLTIQNENKSEDSRGINISPIGVIISLSLSLLMVIGVLYLIIVFTPVGEYLPGHVNEKAREQIMSEVLRIDSLRDEVDKQNRYIANIRTIMDGVEIDSILPPDTLKTKEGYPIETTETEAEFAKEFEEKERFNLTSQAATVGALQELHLFCPTRGLIKRKFDANLRHYGVDIAENPGESVLAILDGTVIMSDYTANDGYVLVIQHKQNLTSVYRNCSSVLKRVGDRVAGGEVIAALGNATLQPDKQQTNHKANLHFELWHRGEPLNPEIYIAF